MAGKRGRPPGSKNKPKAPPADGGPGHNSGKTVEQLSDEQRHALTVQHRKKYESALADKKKADADFKNVCKLARADLGATAIDDIKELIEFESEGSDERFQAELERRLRNARWAGLAIGSQADLFANDAPSLKERAHNEGYRDGIEGKILEPPKHYSPGTDGYAGYTEGWHAGQAEIAGRFKAPGTGDAETLVQTDDGDKPDDFDKDWPDDKQAIENKTNGAAGQPATVN